jgi:hypothetical protein
MATRSRTPNNTFNFLRWRRVTGGTKADLPVCDPDPITLFLPAAENLVASLTSIAEVTLDWDYNGASNPANFQILRSTQSGTGFVPIDTVAGTARTYVDNSVSNGLTYYYVIRALAGSQSSDSNEASVFVPEVFEMLWNTNNTSTGSSAANQITLPLTNVGSYDFIVDWGDGNTDTITAFNQAEVTHTYAAAGSYTVRMAGTINGWQFNNTGDRLKLTRISNWGNLDFTNTNTGAFYGCSNLTITATNAPVMNAASAQNFFRACTSLTSEDFSDFNVSQISNFQGFFQGCTSFNGDISTWNVSSGSNFRQMFDACSSFNSDITNWVMANANSFVQMFRGCTVFNQDLSGWIFGTGAVNLVETFRNCRDFNSNVNWNVTVSAVNQCFQNAQSFNQDLTNWDVSSCPNFTSTFRECDAFNGNITNWDLSSCTSITLMFFRAFAFNRDITGWNFNPSNTISAAQAFKDATSFNQNISSWNTTGFTNIEQLFSGASVFDQNLGSWNVGNIGNANGMFNSSGLSVANYDALLNGWAGQSVQPGVTLGAGTTQYTIATSQAARDTLTNAPNNWTITDGGGI